MAGRELITNAGRFPAFGRYFRPTAFACSETVAM